MITERMRKKVNADKKSSRNERGKVKGDKKSSRKERGKVNGDKKRCSPPNRNLGFMSGGTATVPRSSSSSTLRLINLWPPSLASMHQPDRLSWTIVKCCQLRTRSPEAAVHEAQIKRPDRQDMWSIGFIEDRKP
jgi:hypothetical protein